MWAYHLEARGFRSCGTVRWKGSGDCSESTVVNPLRLSMPVFHDKWRQGNAPGGARPADGSDKITKRPFAMDNLSKQERSERMSRVKSADTGPEMIVRRMVHGMGFRYKLHVRDLPGTPDLVFPRLGKIIFVHGCFWHQHPGCGRLPKSRQDFWTGKLSQNRVRDIRNQRKLRYLGWRILIVWECQLKRDFLPTRLLRFLES